MQQEDDNLKYSPKTFVKAERLCSKKEIQSIIDQNQTIFVYPFKCYYFISDKKSDVDWNQMTVSVSKRLFKKAVFRNLIKRRTKEAYRLHNKSIYCDSHFNQNKKIQIILVFISKEILPYFEIEKSVIQILERLRGQVRGNR
jgi:ribonuclease P protein component